MPSSPILATFTTTVDVDVPGLGLFTAGASDRDYWLIERTPYPRPGIRAMGGALTIPHDPQPVAFMTSIMGALPGGMRLAGPLIVLVEYADGEVVVSETRFHMHAAGATEREAMDAFRRVFAAYLPFLEEREAKLGAHLRNQLAYLRSAITLA